MSSNISRKERSADGGDGGAARDATHIEIVDHEYRFMLHRHWSLYESICYSRYVATRLGVWRKKGRQRVRHLLAKMGLPLVQCQQSFALMDSMYKQRLYAELMDRKDEFSLENVFFPSFTVQSGFNPPVSASDVVYGVSALLDMPSQPAGAAATGPAAAAAAAATAAAAAAGAVVGGVAGGGFYAGLDALQVGHTAVLRRGMQQAMTIQRAIMRQVECVVDSGVGLGKCTNFRYVVLEDQVDQKYFLQPVSLMRLGLTIADTFRYEKQARKRTMPLVVCALDKATETHVVVGLWAELHRREGAVVANEFASIFDGAAQRSSIRLRSTALESTVMFVQSDDMPQFIRALNHQIQAQAPAPPTP